MEIDGTIKHENDEMLIIAVSKWVDEWGVSQQDNIAQGWF